MTQLVRALWLGTREGNAGRDVAGEQQSSGGLTPSLSLRVSF